MVSVIIPMYNSEKTIKDCITSVLNQTYKDFEIIVVNDGSTDKCAEIIAKIQNYTDKIKLINKPNGGVSSARNIGLKNSSGLYIALLDSDDFWYDYKLRKQVDLLQKDNSICFLSCNFDVEKRNRFFFKKFNYLTDIKVSTLVFKNFFQPSTVIFKREIIDTIGLFDENQKFAEEGNYFMRIANKYRCVLMNEKLIQYGNGDNVGIKGLGLSSNLIEMEKGEIKNLKFALNNKYIGIGIFSIAYVFSISKFIKRSVVKWLS